jgi:putative peptide zinc metalloprotease protein
MADPAPEGTAAVGEPGLEPRLDGCSRVTLRPLSITPNGEAFMVGDLARGEFIEVPPIAVTVINALRAGHTLAETAALARDQAGEAVDVEDFVESLIGCGFVAAANGIPLPSSGPELADGGKVGAFAARLARPFYSAAAFAVYAGLFVSCAVLLTVVRELRPHYSQWFFMSNPVLSLELLFVLTMPLVMLHELAHWLGARIEGLPARITVSRRYYLLVMQTDLSGLWALPRKRRLAPLLAGMAFDTLLLAALIAARGSALAGWWHPPTTLVRLTAAVILVQVYSIVFQFFLFLRTDLYGVLITGLGCLNLTRISRLRMTQRYRRLTAAEELELTAASPRDKAASRWYGWVQFGGAIAAIGYFGAFFVPSLIHVANWVGSGLIHSSPSTADFWYVAGEGCVLLLQAGIPPLTYARDRARRTRPAEAGGSEVAQPSAPSRHKRQAPGAQAAQATARARSRS